ncbi:hypothetical protein ABN028_16300 [Actinopolymorpha sp. B17G11]|uniref:hypothetical protein n=1 Tax=unclassified Actinopolymorpha TaxID=2627063 RepID=UPI0032D93D8D
MTTEPSRVADELRVLFCIGVLPDFCAQPAVDFDWLLEPFATRVGPPLDFVSA